MLLEEEPHIQLTFTQKIRLELFGITPTEKKKLPGWKGELQFYAFKCPVHGVVEDYPHGYRQILRCKRCQRPDFQEY
jgi:hypothetical protein